MSELEDLHAVELDMLKAFAALCGKYGLRYTLYCGTLLGAIRHKGFIPWDDDADVAMPLKDFRRFRAVAHELPSPYVLLDWDNCPYYSYPWMTIYADGTTNMDLWQANVDMHQGIRMDIYPFIGAARTRAGQKFQDLLILLARGFRSGEYHRLFRDVPQWDIRLLARIPAWIGIPLGKLCYRLAIRDPETCRTIGTLDAAPFSGKYDKSDWEQMTTASFEGIAFPIPVEYDKVLRIMYGDYMTLPPESQRTGHGSSDRIIDAHKDYREYQKELRGTLNEIQRAQSFHHQIFARQLGKRFFSHAMAGQNNRQ